MHAAKRLLGTAALALAALTPQAGAQASEAEPLISDPAGDVQYDALYSGTRDHDYLDLLAVWVSYDAQADDVVVAMKTTDYGPLDVPPREWGVTCFLRSTARLDGGDRGILQFRFTSVGHTDRIETAANYTETAQRSVPLSHRHRFVYESPGYFYMQVSRQLLLRYADELASLDAQCTELFIPAGFVYPPSGTASGATLRNYDPAEASGHSLDLRQYQPAFPEAAGAAEPIDNATADSTSAGKGTPGLAPYLVVVVLGAVALGRRLR